MVALISYLKKTHPQLEVIFIVSCLGFCHHNDVAKGGTWRLLHSFGYLSFGHRKTCVLHEYWAWFESTGSTATSPWYKLQDWVIASNISSVIVGFWVCAPSWIIMCVYIEASFQTTKSLSHDLVTDISLLLPSSFKQNWENIPYTQLVIYCFHSTPFFKCILSFDQPGLMSPPSFYVQTSV